jgi:tetratricopeptide (TPR) repeat protein
MTSKAEAAFGARLRRLRVQRSLSQRELADPVYTAAYISTVEAGKRRPSRAALEHFARRLGIEVDELLTGKPPGLEAQLGLRLNEARIHASAGRIEEAEKVVEHVRREAKRYDLVRFHARALEAKARCLEQTGDFDRATELYEQVCEMLAEEPAISRTNATVGVARLSHVRGDSHYAIHLLERFLVELVASKTPDPQSLMMVHAGLVLPYFDVGVRDRAALHAEKALGLVSDGFDPYALATMHVQVARVLVDAGRIRDAEASLAKAEDLFRSVDTQTELAMARLAHGSILARVDGARAEVLLLSALEAFEKVGRSLERARATNELARLYRRQGRGGEAKPMLEKALDLLDGSDPNELALTHRELALCAGPDDPHKAEKSLKRALELFELGEDRTELAATYGLLGDLMRLTGREDRACDAYRQGVSQFMDDEGVFASER